MATGQSPQEGGQFQRYGSQVVKGWRKFGAQFQAAQTAPAAGEAARLAGVHLPNMMYARWRLENLTDTTVSLVSAKLHYGRIVTSAKVGGGTDYTFVEDGTATLTVGATMTQVQNVDGDPVAAYLTDLTGIDIAHEHVQLWYEGFNRA